MLSVEIQAYFRPACLMCWIQSGYCNTENWFCRLFWLFWFGLVCLVFLCGFCLVWIFFVLFLTWLSWKQWCGAVITNSIQVAIKILLLGITWESCILLLVFPVPRNWVISDYIYANFILKDIIFCLKRLKNRTKGEEDQCRTQLQD